MCSVISICILFYIAIIKPDNADLLFISAGLFAIGAEISAMFNKK